ncbi:MAG TPA: sugar phosphorylase [Egibacteraceae bacterium]|nr:sugar phosphorylase [Egibacteraceae bacterium]
MPMKPTLAPAIVARLRAHLDRLYGPAEAAEAADRLVALCERFLPGRQAPARPLFDETDVVVITYADQLHEAGRPPLQTLRSFFADHLAGTVTGVHLLPFYPWTSDDGFAVVDYLQVDPAVGSWDDVRALAADVRLMVDAVVNHVSSQNSWFTRWRSGDDHEGWFIEVDPATDLSAVTRPRPQPVLTPYESAGGLRHVWTTFSPDQIDLNYANPDVLLTVTEVLLTYVANGAQILRLDAVAYLWKRLGSSCIHLPETHEVIRLWRSVLDAVAPGTLLITETNVPHAENVSYFGDGGDEAHLVYQFPLAPLVLSAFHLADTTTLQEWAAGLSTPSDTTAFFNFLGSHDGVGVRPAEGLLTPAEIAQLCDLATAHGGGVSYKADADGGMSPYELNTVYFDALTEVDSAEPAPVQVDRFLSAQSILLALAGVPGIYVQALLGSRNWHEGVKQTGRLRTINRRKFDRALLEAELADETSLRALVFGQFRQRIRVRTAEPAFHPTGAQRVVPTPPGVFALERSAPDGSSTVLCLHSVTGRLQTCTVAQAGGVYTDLVTGRGYRSGAGGALRVELPPYAVRWLRRHA